MTCMQRELESILDSFACIQSAYIYVVGASQTLFKHACESCIVFSSKNKYVRSAVRILILRATTKRHPKVNSG